MTFVIGIEIGLPNKPIEVQLHFGGGEQLN